MYIHMGVEERKYEKYVESNANESIITSIFYAIARDLRKGRISFYNEGEEDNRFFRVGSLIVASKIRKIVPSRVRRFVGRGILQYSILQYFSFILLS